MKIAAIALEIPSLKVTNRDILDYIHFYNQEKDSREVELYQRELSILLRKAGIEQRFYRDSSSNERAIDLIKAAIIGALKDASLTRDDIDLLIFCGVGRGFLEPANAYFCAQAAGLECECFDVVDACMSWLRSMDIAQSLIHTGRYTNVLVVNGEFTAYEHGFPEMFMIRDPEQLRYTFPAYTIGEAATATVVTQGGDDWNFHYSSAPSLSDLCSIPLPNYQGFCSLTDKIGLNGVNKFVSYGGKLFDEAVRNMVHLIRQTVDNVNASDIWFAHVPALDPCREIAEKSGLEKERIYLDAFLRYGNLVSASIPAAMFLAERDGKLERGMRVTLAPASAGMAFALCELVY